MLTAVVLLVSPLAATAAEPDRAGVEFFEAKIRPVLVAKCYECHSAEAAEGGKLKGKLLLDSREGAQKGGETGPAVVPGKVEDSLLISALKHESFEMPPTGKLPDAVIADFVKWVEMGAPDPREGKAAPAARQIDLAAGRQFWSFQPLEKTEPPQVKNENWSRTPIDRFVLARQEQAGLHPNPAAQRRTLIRRAYFDLLGLPPKPEEMEAFVNDPNPKAYEALIDRLLESPHYGERWARHWLDVARFAESHGYEQDYDRPNAYPYRDFLIKAFNADMPYDQFVRWQLAGDELAPDDALAMMATGFLGAGAFPTQLTEAEFESARYDELDDMTATTGVAFLGLSIGCARCHDHKFDPIPTKDYYRLASTFTKTIRSEIELDLDPAATKQALAAWEAEHQPLSAALEAFEREQLPQRFEKWLQERPAEPAPLPAWVVVDVVEAKSEGGATFTHLDDGSLLAGGANPNQDAYTFVAETSLPRITAIRLEAMAHESLVKSGPGRADNGNFALSEVTLKAEPLTGGGESVTVKLVNPRADFEQNNGHLAIAASLDGNKQTGWAVDPQFGKNHAAVFEIDPSQSIAFEGGTKLTLTLEFHVNARHAIGRPRLSISTAATPGFGGDEGRQPVVETLHLLHASGGKLTDAQRAALLKWYRTTDAEWTSLNQKVQEHVAKKPKPQTTKVQITSEGFPHMPHHADDRGFPHFYPQTHFLTRGDVNRKEEVAPPGFLQVLTESGLDESHWAADPPKDWTRTTFQRASLAQWMTDPHGGAGHLAARVIVNRLWQHHFGHGIVATPNDFGAQGEPPSHPELLDWLASDLIENGWRLKRLHKLIMTSSVYLQNGEFDEARAKIDRENTLLWRRAPQRLEGEAIRDAMLHVSGMLDETMYGPGTLDQNMRRRSVYFFIKRSQLIPTMMLFDWPEHLVSIGARSVTTIAPQSLMFMNSPQARQYAEGFAGRLQAKQEESVRQGYLLALGRGPTEREKTLASEFMARQRSMHQQAGHADPERLALADFCQMLMSLNEFVYVE